MRTLRIPVSRQKNVVGVSNTEILATDIVELSEYFEVSVAEFWRINVCRLQILLRLSSTISSYLGPWL